MPPQLLVSVRDAVEAAAAAAGGADWIDLKEPARGALGPVEPATAAAVANCLPPSVPLSAAAGELADWADGRGRALLDVRRISLVKLGLAHCAGSPGSPPLKGTAAGGTSSRPHATLLESSPQPHLTQHLPSGERGPARATASDLRQELRRVHSEICAAGKQLVLAAYADSQRAAAPSFRAVLELSSELGLQWLLIDTFDKSAGRLLDCLPPEELAQFLVRCRAAGLRTAVAGRLRLEELSALPSASIDVVGVRSAACGGDRNGPVEAANVRSLQAVLAACRRGTLEAVPAASR